MKTVRFVLISTVYHFLIVATLVESASPWPWRGFNNLGRVPNRSNWRLKNALAMASNKSTCSGDFYFMLDSSSSIGEHVFLRMTKFVKLLVKMFGPSQVQYSDLNIGLVRFSSRAEVLSKPIPPNTTVLLETLDKTLFIDGGRSSIVRAFRLMATPSIWETYYDSENIMTTKPKFQIADEMDDPLPIIKDKRRRQIVVFTDGQFSDSAPGMALATLGLCRQMAAPVVFVGIRGENSDLNLHNLEMLAESPNYLYLLGPILAEAAVSVDELSAWNLAAYLCYTLQKREGYYY